MWETIIKMATESGIWAVMFVVLFYKQIKESKTREEKYQATIDTLADIKTDIEEIKNAITTSMTNVERHAETEKE